MQFDGGMKVCAEQLQPVPACFASGIDALIGKQNQHGAGL